MNIVFNIKKTDNFQPKVYDLGQISTTLQDLLDSSKIIVLNKRPIVLKITDTEDNENFYMLNLEDYIGENTYGIGKDITTNDLIPLNSGSSTSVPVALPVVYLYDIEQSGSNTPVVSQTYKTENATSPSVLSIRESLGYYVLTFNNGNLLPWDLNKVFITAQTQGLPSADFIGVNVLISNTRVDIETSIANILSDDVLGEANGFRFQIKIEVYP